MSHTVQVRTSVRRIGAAIGLALGCQAALAAPALEEVVVTAQKRTESLQDTPISIAAFDNQALENKGINSVVDLQAQVPNLQLTPHPNSATTARVFMRGVGNNDDQITQDPSVAVYLDGVYVARSQGLAMDVADIERIEVLRGPQGTLYGRNATGGAINFITRAPELDRLGVKQTFTFGNRNLFRSRTSLNLPLAENLAMKVSYLTVDQDGFIKAANDQAGFSTFGEKDREAWRADLLWQPNDVFELRYSYDRSNVDDTPVAVVGLEEFQLGIPTEGHRPSHANPNIAGLQPNEVVAEGHTLTATWELAPALTLKSITAYRELENYTNQSYFFSGNGVTSNASDHIYDTTIDSTQDQFSQELQLLGDALDGRLQYIAGLYYFRETGDSYDTTTLYYHPGSGTALTPPVFQERNGSIENKAYAVFGQATYTPSILEERLHVTLGARWSKDERNATLENYVFGFLNPTSPQGDAENDFTDFSPSLVVGYDISDTINAYAKVVQGYKTGGFNVRASSSAAFARGFDPEELMSYEVGVKSEMLDNRLRLNAAVFYASYDDIQIQAQTVPNDPTKTDVLNAGEATIEGVELDMTALLTDGLTLNLNYAYLNADYEKIKDPLSGGDISDRFQFVNAPQHSGTIDLEYIFPPMSFGTLTANVGYNWQEEKFTSSTDSRLVVDDYGLLNARLTLSEIPAAQGHLKVAVWGSNLEDKEYYAAHFSAIGNYSIFGEPRSYGIDLTYEH